MARSRFSLLFVGIVAGCLATAGALYAQAKKDPPPDASSAPFDIVDTPGSTYLLNRQTGQVWRISFTEVGGNKYWYAMHVPQQQPGTFEEFQTKLRREMAGGR